MWNLLANFTPLNWENIKNSLTITWKGLLAIFVVIFIIILAVGLVNGAINKVQEAKKQKEEAYKAENENSTSNT